jgi:FtsP/CotA-like multicopper oxidase with cupredoxin domain
MGCSGEPSVSERASQPDAWDEGVALPLPEDLNPDPHVLEVALEATLAPVEIQPGVLTQTWTYNGGVPGPLLRAQKGDRLIVHFTNRLPEPTLVHWHGVRLDSAMDGTAAVQEPVLPGESFTYDFVLPDAGTFWYHPHANSSAQVGYGLYGPLVVDDPDDPIDVEDVVLVFSDMTLDAEGQLRPGDNDGWFGDYFGREGGTLLINGRVQPRLGARAGLPQRWRIINAARARFLELAVPNAEIVRVGGDVGLVERAEPLETLRLATSERAEILVTLGAGAAGDQEALSRDPDRFRLGVRQPDQPLIALGVEPREGHASPQLPDPLRELPPLDLAGAKHRHIELGETTLDGLVHLSIDGEVHQEDAAGHQHATSHVAYVGDTEVWEVINTTGYDHPFHLHGFAFEVLDVAGEPWPVRELKDSVNIPAGATLRFAVTYDDRPGLWMFHCHILDHAGIGMMAVLEVRPTQEKP